MKSAKLGQGRCRRGGREREEWMARTAGQRKSQMGKQGPVAKGTMTLIYSPCKPSALEPQDWQ